MKRTTILLTLAVLTCFVGGYLTCVNAQPTTSPTTPAEIHCKHFIHGYPLGAPATNDLIIRDVYALSSNDQRKFADWVCYRLTPHEVMGSLDLDRKWINDPWLDPTETLEGKPSSQDDYRGAHSAQSYDRGHQAPLASFKGSRSASQVNCYSNITPQKAGLNEGPWQRLEAMVRWLVKRYGSVWVMTGPLYESNMPALTNCDEAHTVPSGYWKIIVLDDNGTTRVAAFIMGQDTPRGANVADKLCKISDVEQRSRLTFLWELPAADQATPKGAEPTTWVAQWRQLSSWREP